MDENNLIISSTEIIKDKLYFATLAKGYKPKSTKNSRYFHIEDEIVYESFYNDFGPYHLCHLSQFCRKLTNELADATKNKKVVFYTSNVDTLRLNAAYLIGSYTIIYLGKSPQWVHNRLTENCNWKLLKFRDASDGPMLFDINLLDVFQGLHIAHKTGFFNFDDFDEYEYLYFEKVENGDLNWIIPRKMLAFSGPHARSRVDRGYQLHSPEHYHKYFKTNNVTTIVRLNKVKYDAKQFTSHGFQHRDLFFVDGSAPTSGIVTMFIKICESAPGAVAVHCKAGLGRTGTLIGCYMMKHHGFTARQAIAWLRICRPGSVIGLQQAFMENIQARMFAEGEIYRMKLNIQSFPKFKYGIYSDTPPEPLSIEAENIENKVNDNIPAKEKPVSLNTILNNVGNTSINNNPARLAKKTKKLDNTNETFNSDNSLDPENNKGASNCQKKRPTHPSYMTAEMSFVRSNNLLNANNTNLKSGSRPKAARPTILTSTFPSRISSISLCKLHSAKSPNKPMQRTTLSLKTYPRKNSNLSYNRETSIQHNATMLSPNNNTSTITALTESCSIDAKNGNISDVNVSVTSSQSNVRTNNRDKNAFANKTMFGHSVASARKKHPKNAASAGDLNSNVDLSGSDTTVANLSVDSLEVTPASNEKVRRKRDKSKSPEPPIGEYASSDNYEETTNSQGNKLYKIKAMREKYPAVRSAAFSKRDGSKTKASVAIAKKK